MKMVRNIRLQILMQSLYDVKEDCFPKAFEKGIINSRAKILHAN